MQSNSESRNWKDYIMDMRGINANKLLKYRIDDRIIFIMLRLTEKCYSLYSLFFMNWGSIASTMTWLKIGETFILIRNKIPLTHSNTFKYIIGSKLYTIIVMKWKLDIKTTLTFPFAIIFSSLLLSNHSFITKLFTY
jgi:hypothetical protein